MKTAVSSEVGPLEAVVVNPPMDEFDRMVPANLHAFQELPDGSRRPNPDYLMFDDLILLERMQIEHRQLREVLAAATGPRGVHTVRGMVAASLSEEPIRIEVIDQVIALEQELYGMSDAAAGTLDTELRALNAMRLTDTLFTGVERYSQRQLLRWPIPNALFARDLGAVLGDALVMTYAARAGRRRDMLLARFVARYHPLFCDTERIDIAEDGPVRAPDGTPIATLEGGDLQVLSDRIAVVGCGIRTCGSVPTAGCSAAGPRFRGGRPGGPPAAPRRHASGHALHSGRPSALSHFSSVGRGPGGAECLHPHYSKRR